mmetsp:Transcript_129025/g.413353  ORF Transcript_129025/g.413353 Transcript_129025/m.413353 type:complete len:393 (+) Transcript_129025:6740-7918(+)
MQHEDSALGDKSGGPLRASSVDREVDGLGPLRQHSDIIGNACGGEGKLDPETALAQNLRNLWQIHMSHHGVFDRHPGALQGATFAVAREEQEITSPKRHRDFAEQGVVLRRTSSTDSDNRSGILYGAAFCKVDQVLIDVALIVRRHEAYVSAQLVEAEAGVSEGNSPGSEEWLADVLARDCKTWTDDVHQKHGASSIWRRPAVNVDHHGVQHTGLEQALVDAGLVVAEVLAELHGAPSPVALLTHVLSAINERAAEFIDDVLVRECVTHLTIHGVEPKHPFTIDDLKFDNIARRRSVPERVWHRGEAIDLIDKGQHQRGALALVAPGDDEHGLGPSVQEPSALECGGRDQGASGAMDLDVAEQKLVVLGVLVHLVRDFHGDHDVAVGQEGAL